MTYDLLSTLCSAPPGPGTQQVLECCPGSCSYKKPNILPNQGKENRPVQGEQSWLRAICFIIPSTRLAPPVRPAGRLLPSSNAWEVTES